MPYTTAVAEEVVADAKAAAMTVAENVIAIN
jgi:hypothetical protein